MWGRFGAGLRGLLILKHLGLLGSITKIGLHALQDAPDFGQSNQLVQSFQLASVSQSVSFARRRTKAL